MIILIMNILINFDKKLIYFDLIKNNDMNIRNIFNPDYQIDQNIIYKSLIDLLTLDDQKPPKTPFPCKLPGRFCFRPPSYGHYIF